jgi:hypothetical protein
MARLYQTLAWIRLLQFFQAGLFPQLPYEILDGMQTRCFCPGGSLYSTATDRSP